MKQRFTMTAVTENTPGVLHRLTAVFTRRKINIESLTVSETEREGVSRFTVVFLSEPQLVEKLVGAIRRIVETVDAFACEDKDLLFKEIAFLRVGFKSDTERQAIEEMARDEAAAVVMTNGKTLVLEKTGGEEDINDFERKFRERFVFIRTFIRSGRIAIRREIGDVFTGEGV
jgi:acetolactate synthase-1/3 small subunit